MKTTLLLFICLIALSCGGSGSSVRSGSSHSWKETGTSADEFMKTAMKAEADYQASLQTYREAFLYLSLLITNPSDAVRKDYRSALVFAESVGSQFTKPDQLTANFSAQQMLVKEAIQADGDVLRNLQMLARELPSAKATLTQLNTTGKNLSEQGPGVLERAVTETTDQATVSRIRVSVSGMTETMSGIHQKAPGLMENISRLIETVNQVSTGLQ